MSKPDLHYSDMSLAMMCGLRIENRDKHGNRPPTTPLLNGHGLHVPGDMNFKSKIETGEFLSLSETQDIARDTINRLWSEKGVRLIGEEKTKGEEQVRGDLIDSVVIQAGCYRTEVIPSVDPVASEKPFVLTHNQLECDIHGRIDLEERLVAPEGHEIGIRDLKTTARTKPVGFEHKMLQVTTYSMAGWADLGYVPQCRIDWVVKTKQPKIDSRVTTRTIRDMEKMLFRIERIYRAIKTGALYPTDPSNWWCDEKWCGWWDVCEAI
jgi:hypothetical protein